MDNKSIKKHYKILIADEKPTNKQRLLIYLSLERDTAIFFLTVSLFSSDLWKKKAIWRKSQHPLALPGRWVLIPF